jgi:hypothetical protein
MFWVPHCWQELRRVLAYTRWLQLHSIEKSWWRDHSEMRWSWVRITERYPVCFREGEAQMRLLRVESVNWRRMRDWCIRAMLKRWVGNCSLTGQFSRWIHRRRPLASSITGSISTKVRALTLSLPPGCLAGDEMRRIVLCCSHSLADVVRTPDMDKVASLVSSQIVTLSFFTVLPCLDLTGGR